MMEKYEKLIFIISVYNVHTVALHPRLITRTMHTRYTTSKKKTENEKNIIYLIHEKSHLHKIIRDF